MSKPQGFSKWARELVEEDIKEGLGEINRPPEAMAQLYQMYLDAHDAESEKSLAESRREVTA